MKKQSNYKDEGADEIKRMMILKEMEELEQKKELKRAEKIQENPVAIRGGHYIDIDTAGTKKPYHIPRSSTGNFSFTHAYPKVGKSFFMSLLVSAYQGGKNEYTGK